MVRHLLVSNWSRCASATLRVALLGAILLTGCDDASGSGAGGGGGGSGGSPDGSMGPLDEPIPGCAPAPLASTGDAHQDCVDRINQLRAECQGLEPLIRWSDGEACADAQAEYDSDGHAPHSGWGGGVECEDGWAQNECPGWPSVDSVVDGCLQDMWDEGPGEPYSAHGHYINMTNANYTEVACGFYTTDGGAVWAVMNFR